MSGRVGYGWISYYFNLLLLISMDHRRRIRFIRRKAQRALADPDRAAQLRTLLHCTDWPIDLLQSSRQELEALKAQEELEKLQQEMVERYQRARQLLR